MPPKASHNLNGAMPIQALAIVGLAAAEYSTPQAVREYFGKAVRAKGLRKLRKEMPEQTTGLRLSQRGETTMNLIGLSNSTQERQDDEDQDEQLRDAARRSKRHSVGGYQPEGWQFDALGIGRYHLDERRQGKHQAQGFYCTGGYHAGGFSVGTHPFDLHQVAEGHAGELQEEEPSGPYFGTALPSPQMPSPIKMKLDTSKLGRRHEALGSHPPCQAGTVERANIRKSTVCESSESSHDLPILWKNSTYDWGSSSATIGNFEWDSREMDGDDRLDEQNNNRHETIQSSVVRKMPSFCFDQTTTGLVPEKSNDCDYSPTTTMDRMDRLRAEWYEELSRI